MMTRFDIWKRLLSVSLAFIVMGMTSITTFAETGIGQSSGDQVQGGRTGDYNNDSEKNGSCNPCAEKLKKRNFTVISTRDDGRSLCHLAEKGNVWMNDEEFIRYIYPECDARDGRSNGEWLQDLFYKFGKPVSFSNNTEDNWPSGADFISAYMTGYAFNEDAGFYKCSGPWIEFDDIISRLEGNQDD